MNQQPLVSIIIPTYNSEKTLHLCLKSIKRQTYKNVEVIVVDNFSEDKTQEIARKNGAKVFLMGPERSAQKNYGAIKAQGELLYFIDSDFVLHPNVVEESVNLIKCGNDAIIVLNISHPNLSFIAKVRFYERISYYESEVYEAARFMKKKIFMKTGGFDESLHANEDYDLHQRLLSVGARIGRTKNSFEIHIGEPRSLREFMVKNIYYGSNITKYFKKNPNPIYMAPIRFTFFKRNYIAYLGRRWLPGLLFVPLIKIMQGIAVQIGIFLKLNISPYTIKSLSK